MRNRETIDSRDVLDPNAKVRREFSGNVIGRFKRLGPNSWDPYIFEAIDGGRLQVLPGLRVFVEPSRPVIRMRHKGDVVAVSWNPDGDDPCEPRDPAELREVFVNTFFSPFKNKVGFGAAAAIARKLSQ